MGHTILKHIYCEEEHKFVECEVMVIDEAESLPGTDRREIILSCSSCGAPYSELSDTFTSDVSDLYPETELIDQYEDFDNRQD